MTDRIGSAADVPIRRLPWYVPLFGPIARFLLAAGVPLGFNGLITVRGRKSGLPRTTPVAIIEVSGRRWVWAPWGEVQWVRNLRAAGGATITFRRREQEVSATELDATQSVTVETRKAAQAASFRRSERNDEMPWSTGVLVRVVTRRLLSSVSPAEESRTIVDVGCTLG